MLPQQNQNKTEVGGVANSSSSSSSSSSSNSDSIDLRTKFEEHVSKKFRLAAKLNPRRAKTYMSWSSSERAFESRFGTIGINDPSMRSREYDIIKEGIKRCPGDPSLYMIRRCICAEKIGRKKRWRNWKL